MPVVKACFNVSVYVYYENKLSCTVTSHFSRKHQNNSCDFIYCSYLTETQLQYKISLSAIFRHLYDEENFDVLYSKL